jgi:hypothetical protein
MSNCSSLPLAGTAAPTLVREQTALPHTRNKVVLITFCWRARWDTRCGKEQGKILRIPHEYISRLYFYWGPRPAKISKIQEKVSRVN